MIVDLGNSLIEKLESASLPFLDKYAGVVKVLEYKEKNSHNDGFVTKRFPAECKITLEECKQGKRYNDLLPDNSKKSVLFLEDNGLRLIKTEGSYSHWRASLDLVCWLNLPKLGYTSSCSYSALAILGILKALSGNKSNYLDTYQYVGITVQGEKSKSQDPFRKYSIDESVHQYLTYPYDFFVLEIEIDFRLDERCLKISNLGSEINCLTK